MSFDAAFATPDDDTSRHRISQNAVDNLARIGGGSGALSSTFLRFLDEFSYHRLGLSCRLRNGVCEMGGVESSERGYYIVKGGRVSTTNRRAGIQQQGRLERFSGSSEKHRGTNHRMTLRSILMKAINLGGVGLVSLTMLLASCVTINVYFPAAAAEKAADTIIEEVWGKDRNPTTAAGSSLSLRSPKPSSLRWSSFSFPPLMRRPIWKYRLPKSSRLTASMKARHRDLSAYYEVGAAGLSRDGLISVRDAKLVPLNERNRLKQLVAAENADRNALYKEIAIANGHPEWERDIRNTFASRWIQKARAGAWYDKGSGWQQK